MLAATFVVRSFSAPVLSKRRLLLSSLNKHKHRVGVCDSGLLLAVCFPQRESLSLRPSQGRHGVWEQGESSRTTEEPRSGLTNHTRRAIRETGGSSHLPALHMTRASFLRKLELK